MTKIKEQFRTKPKYIKSLLAKRTPIVACPNPSLTEYVCILSMTDQNILKLRNTKNINLIFANRFIYTKNILSH